MIGLFFITQLIGIAVINSYSPMMKTVQIDNGTSVNVTTYNLPYGMDPPQESQPKSNLLSIIIAVIIAVIVMLFLIKFKAEIILRIWFFVVVIIALALTLYAGLKGIEYAWAIALVIAIPLAILKVFKRNIVVHNIAEIGIYPGIAAIFVPLLNIWTMVILLILLSLYDMYAVWHAKFMQKMAKYQIEKVRVFGGFLIPYMSKKQRDLIAKKKTKKLRNKRMKITLAILGGGDIVFPMILAGVVLHQFGFLSALIIAIGATLALAGIFIYAQKGKAYPALPFLTIGCFIALGIVYLINLL